MAKGICSHHRLFCIAITLLTIVAATVSGNVTPKFASSVDAEMYPAARGLKLPLTFKWDFSRKRDYRFKYEQVSESRMRGFGDERERLNKSTSSADLVVRSVGDGTARLLLDNIVQIVTFPTAETPQEITQRIPTVVLAAVHEDGTTESAVGGQQAVVKLLFPLPSQNLAVGETTELPVEIPFNAMGSSLVARGKTRVRNAGWSILGKRACIRLEADTAVEQPTIPEEVAGKYDFAMNAHAVYFFDPSQRTFIRAVIAVNTSMNVDAPSPIASSSETKGKESVVADRVQVVMVTDDLITLSEK